jgi:hypothetical protein
MMMIFPLRFRLNGTVLEYKPYPRYPHWLVAADLAAAIAAVNAVTLYELPFDYTVVSPLALVTVPALATVTKARLHIVDPFDVPTTISIGDVGDAARIMGAADNNPLEAGIYEVSADYEYADLTALLLTIDAFGATAGQARVILEYEP